MSIEREPVITFSPSELQSFRDIQLLGLYVYLKSGGGVSIDQIRTRFRISKRRLNEYLDYLVSRHLINKFVEKE